MDTPANSKILNLKLNVTELDAQQVRLLKSINAHMVELLTTQAESDYFENSAELMRLIASVIKQANFHTGKSCFNIPYAEQALEYSMENINENIYSSKTNTYDN